ncbi:hypothetical protein ACFX2B_026467 [Malus domestica]
MLWGSAHNLFTEADQLRYNFSAFLHVLHVVEVCPQLVHQLQPLLFSSGGISHFAYSISLSSAVSLELTL